MDAEKIKHFQNDALDNGGRFAVVDIAAIQANYHLIRHTSKAKAVCACVKSNAYGHGLLQVARALHESDYLSVSNLAEVQALHQEGFKNVVFLNAPSNITILKRAFEMGCVVVIYCVSQLELLKDLSGTLRIWLKVNTGMNRLGIGLDEFEQCMRTIKNLPNVQLEAVMSHFACADEPENALNQKQLKAMQQLSSQCDGVKSFRNSYACAQHLIDTDHVVRPGISLYGACSEIEGLHLSMRLYATVLQVRTVEKGECVGYGGHWCAHRRSKIAIVGIGYGDGFPYARNPSDLWVNFKGQKAKVVGSVSMNSFQANVSDIEHVEVGDVVQIWNNAKDLERFSAACGATSYQTLVGVHADRVKFNYVSEA